MRYEYWKLFVIKLNDCKEKDEKHSRSVSKQFKTNTKSGVGNRENKKCNKRNG